jgi:peptidoglycan/LPS O-acetylase OafA/YrhL
MKLGTTKAKVHLPILFGDNLNRNNFDLIRFILAVAVIFSHSFSIYYTKEIDAEPVMIFTQNQLSTGSIAVSFFFVISGFLILKSLYNTKTLSQYFKKRILRIVPGFFIAFIVSVIIIAPLSTIYVDHRLTLENVKAYFMAPVKKELLFDMVTLQCPHSIKCFRSSPLKDQINLAMWTIQYEFVCYLLLPFLVWLGMFKRKSAMIVLFFLFYIVLVIQNENDNFLNENTFPYAINHFIYLSYLPRFLVYFLAGSYFYLYQDQVIRSKYLALLSFTLLFLSCAWVKCLDMILPFAGSYLLFYIAYHPAINFHNFAKKGDFSYGVYLYGWPIQQLVINYLHPYINVYGLFFISAPLACLAAFFSWHYVEKVFLNMKDKPISINSIFKLKAS